MSEIRPAISFDAGIEQILSHKDNVAPTLPDSPNVASGAGRYEKQLDDVLFPPSLEQSLADSFRPEISNLDLLTPVGYEAALCECEQLIDEQLADANTDQNRESLGNLKKLLTEEQELRSLLRTYRHLLHQA